MPNKSGTIARKKRLAAIKQGQSNEPSQSVVTSPEPLIKELSALLEVSNRSQRPEPKTVAWARV